MSTLPLFDQILSGKPAPIGRPLTGEELRDSGMESVLNHTPNEYREVFLEVIRLMPRGSLFTVEDVRERAGDPPPEVHYNAMGALMRRAASKNLIVRTSERRKAKRVSLHASEIAVWRKL